MGGGTLQSANTKGVPRTEASDYQIERALQRHRRMKGQKTTAARTIWNFRISG